MKTTNNNNTMKAITDQQIEAAAKKYSRAVTGAMSGCLHPAAVLRWALASSDATCRRLAANYITSGHGACWNALCNVLPAKAWIVWYNGDGK